MIRARFLSFGIGLALIVGFVSVASASRAGDAQTRIEGMDENERHKLSQQKNRFDQLDDDTKRDLRRLDAELTDDQRGEQLRKVMDRYCRWLQTLSPSERAELRSLEPAERTARVQELRAKQVKAAAKAQEKRSREERGARDMEVVRSWFKELAREHQGPLMKKLPGWARQRWDDLDEEQRQRTLMGLVWGEVQRARTGKSSIVKADDLEEVMAKLSPQTRETLAKQMARNSRNASTGNPPGRVGEEGSSRGGRRRPQVSETQLKEFFNRELSSQRRDRLNQLPPEDFREALRREYHRANRARNAGPSDGRRPQGPPHRPPRGRHPDQRGPDQRRPESGRGDERGAERDGGDFRAHPPVLPGRPERETDERRDRPRATNSNVDPT